MTAFNVLELLCGLALFLYGMDVMGDALKKSAGNKLKIILAKMTSNPVKGFLLGLVVTAIIQSSSATTVMVVGFVNSGTMTLVQSVGVIIGANLGTAVTAWLTALSSVEGGSGTLAWTEWLKPDAWMPMLAVLGICFIMFSKRGKKKDLGSVLLGFAVLMVGMDIMSGSVAGLRSSETFKNILIMFENPILGILAGTVLTMIVQSSSASVGILQSLTVTGAVTYGSAIPIIMGQNIGTCITALISAVSANKNGKRAAMVHLYFNVIGVIFWLSMYYIFNAIFGFLAPDTVINAWGIAGVHTIFKILSVIAIAPFYKQLAKLAEATIRDKKNDNEPVSLLDERLFETPVIAAARATEVTYAMAQVSIDALRKSFSLFKSYDQKLAYEVNDLEGEADKYEDSLGSYLVKLSACDMDERDALQITKLLHLIGDLERISDHAVNIVESAEEIKDKNISFSAEANRELGILMAAVEEIVDITYRSLMNNDLVAAAVVESLEEVIDDLRDQIKINHIRRLQKSECTIEHGFVLSDLLTNFERVADHCSNIASCVVEISKYDALDLHKFSHDMKEGNEGFTAKYNEYKSKYAL
ncbi:MAG: Na/Pi cotransporter family protein [Clostridia bacterium]|nr:Na/Pi cotransporter family protein [Clostridia bacterium]